MQIKAQRSNPPLIAIVLVHLYTLLFSHKPYYLTKSHSTLSGQYIFTKIMTGIKKYSIVLLTSFNSR
jgi:hypothetical protein